MRKNSNMDLEQVQLFIDRIQNHQGYDVAHSRVKYEKLLAMSEKINYPYGQALGHMYLAQYHGMIKNEQAYRFNIDKAWELAKSKNYLDIQTNCYKAEAQHSARCHDDIQAMGMCVEGLKLSTQVRDQKSVNAFYYHIGEIFERNNAYENAERFYLKALQQIKPIPEKRINFYRKSILLKLSNLCYMLKKAKGAREYYEQSEEIVCDIGGITFNSAAIQLRLLTLENKEAEAEDKARELINNLKDTLVEETLRRPAYLLLMESLICLSMAEEATWCMGQINNLYLNGREDIGIQKMRIALAKLTGEGEEEAYRQFYAITLKEQSVNKISMGNSFKNLIALAETSKENTRLMEERNDLQNAVNTDELTKISNRRYFSKLISKLIQDKDITSMGYIMVDVDHFKEYNDFYGHSKGDEVLVTIANILNDCRTEDSYVGRYGGDEFSCIMVNKTEKEILDFVEMVRQKLEQLQLPHKASKVAETVTLSFGIYNEAELKNIDEATLIERADKALYLAKKQSRNCYAIYS